MSSDPPNAAAALQERRSGQQPFGPGADADILDKVRTTEQLQAGADPASYEAPDMPGGLVLPYAEGSDEIRKLISEIEMWRGEDPTWGFAMMVIAYDASSNARLPQALKNCICILERQLYHHSFTLPIWATEALQRLRLDLVQDRAVLENASDEQIRRRFRMLLRSRRVITESNNRPPPPARNMACVILDAQNIATLADLTFPEDTHAMRYSDMWEEIKLRVLDAYWQNPRQIPDGDESDSDENDYMGFGWLSVNAMAKFYARLTQAANTGAMEDMHPLHGFP